jgi:hypothetical protein
MHVHFAIRKPRLFPGLFFFAALKPVPGVALGAA